MGVEKRQIAASLMDPSERVRRSAIDALRGIDSEESIACLIFALNDDSRDVRWAAVTTLGCLRALPATLLLESMFHVEKDPGIRASIVESIADIGAASAPDFLRSALKHGQIGVRAQASEGLGRLNVQSAGPALSNILKKDRSLMVRAEAALALGVLNWTEATPIIKQQFQKERRAYYKVLYAEALLELGKREYFEYLFQAIRSRDSSTSQLAAVRLSYYCDASTRDRVHRTLVERLRREKESPNGSPVFARTLERKLVAMRNRWPKWTPKG